MGVNYIKLVHLPTDVCINENVLFMQIVNLA